MRKFLYLLTVVMWVNTSEASQQYMTGEELEMLCVNGVNDFNYTRGACLLYVAGVIDGIKVTFANLTKTEDFPECFVLQTGSPGIRWSGWRELKGQQRIEAIAEYLKKQSEDGKRKLPAVTVALFFLADTFPCNNGSPFSSPEAAARMLEYIEESMKLMQVD